MTIDDLLEDLEAGPDHELALLYIREHKGCSINDVIYYLESMVKVRYAGK